jgi:membrane protease subunit HflK
VDGDFGQTTENAVKAFQDKERQRNEGEAYANDVIPRAQGAASRLREEAAGYKQRVISTAEGDASRFKQVQTEYAKAPEVTRQRMYLETMQQIYANTSKVMVDAKGQGNLLYLPLDKLMQAAGAVPAAQAMGTETAPAPAVARVPVQAQAEAPPQLDSSLNNASRREPSLRSRDRESR